MTEITYDIHMPTEKRWKWLLWILILNFRMLQTQGFQKLMVQFLVPRWLCSYVRQSKTGRVLWCSTTTSSFDNVQTASKTPLAYCVQFLTICVCTVLYCTSLCGTCLTVHWLLESSVLENERIEKSNGRYEDCTCEKPRHRVAVQYPRNRRMGESTNRSKCSDSQR
jgi:hypothetical protein